VLRLLGVKTVDPPVTRRTLAQVRILGRYRLTELIAVGGSAEVWRALDEAKQRAVAVKLLHAHLLPDAASRDRLIGEARAVASLSHPGIIRVLDIDPGPRPAIVLELVDGEPLSARLQRGGPIPPGVASGIAAALADALYHAHVHGVIHRDVKPGNVLLARDGLPRLVDFGIARVLSDGAEGRTQTGLVMGTLRYMAPEQLAGEPVTPRVDLYGLGAVLHEMLTGRPPYEPTSPVGLLDAQASGPPALPGVDPGLRAVVRACLRSRAEARPRHAGFVAEALRAWLAGDAAPALALDAPASPHREDETRTAGAVPDSHRAGPLRGARLRPLVALGIALALLVGGIAGIAGLGSMSRAAAPAPTPIASAADTAPAWATSLSDAYRRDCGPDLESAAATPRQLIEMGEAAAGRYIDALTAACRSAAASAAGSGAGGGHGTDGGNGHGHGHGHD
jgi:eukaryotic-like serine/threonine-protein kinase